MRREKRQPIPLAGRAKSAPAAPLAVVCWYSHRQLHRRRVDEVAAADAEADDLVLLEVRAALDGGNLHRGAVGDDVRLARQLVHGVGVDDRAVELALELGGNVFHDERREGGEVRVREVLGESTRRASGGTREAHAELLELLFCRQQLPSHGEPVELLLGRGSPHVCRGAVKKKARRRSKESSGDKSGG